MKTTKLLQRILVVLLLTATLQASAQTSRIAGSWKINLAKSELNGAPSYTLSKRLVIDITNSATLIRRTGEDDAGKDSVSVEKVTSDGKTATLKNTNGVTKEFKIGRSADGRTLTETFNYTGNEDDLSFAGTETLVLSQDGRSLQVTRHVKASSDFEYTVKGWYDRAGN